MPAECMFVVQLISTVPIQKQVCLIEPMWKHMTRYLKDISGSRPRDFSEALGAVFVQQVERDTDETLCAQSMCV